MKKAAVVALVVVVVGFVVLSIHGIYRSDVSRRPEAEIKALSAALESYRSDYGSYPSDPLSTEQLKANSSFDPAHYIKASQFLYRALSGGDGREAGNKGPDSRKAYFEFRPQMLRSVESGGAYIVDPWGNSYGYSTFKSVHPANPEGNNPTFDLWSTAGGKSGRGKERWIKNW